MLLAAIAIVGASGSASVAEPKFKGWTGPKPVVECVCRYPGGRAQLGETVCLSVGGRSYLAICEKVLNNTNWRKVADSCTPSTPVTALDWLEDLAQLP